LADIGELLVFTRFGMPTESVVSFLGLSLDFSIQKYELFWDIWTIFGPLIAKYK